MRVCLLMQLCQANSCMGSANSGSPVGCSLFCWQTCLDRCVGYEAGGLGCSMALVHLLLTGLVHGQ
jgi:hypothetical protein